MGISLDRTRSQDVDLAILLDGVHRGDVVLPEFQRDFVWGIDDVKALLATVLTGWPMGSLLLMDGKSGLFGVRTFDSSPASDDSAASKVDPRYIVLDGQQRLTALYHAFYGRGPIRYALRYAALGSVSIEALDDAIVSYRSEQWDRDFAQPAQAVAGGLIPTTALRSAADFFEWRDEAVRSSEGIDVGLEGTLNEIYRSYLSGLHRYDVPAVLVDSSVEPAAIARIFERVNRTGLTLGTFDLVVARSFTNSFNLRERWEDACNGNPDLFEFVDGNGLPVLAAIALRAKGDLRQSAILGLTGEDVRQYWDKAIESLTFAVELARGTFGAQNLTWMPNQYLLTVLAALRMNDPDLPASPRVKSWYWYTGFTGAYDVGSNTRAVSDYKRLKDGRWDLPQVTVLIREEIINASRKNGASFHRSFLSLLMAQGPKSLVDGELLGANVSATSVFERATFRTLPEPSLHLRTLSMVLRSSGEQIGAVRAGLRTQPDQVLESQLIPAGIDDDNPEDFLSDRLDMVIATLLRDADLPIVVMSETESQRRAVGIERFNLLVDLLVARDREPLADELEFVDWDPDKSVLSVTARNQASATQLFGSDGEALRGLVDELPLSNIHVYFPGGS